MTYSKARAPELRLITRDSFSTILIGTDFSCRKIILIDPQGGALPLLEVGRGLGPCLEFGGKIWGNETKQNGKF